MLTCQKKKEIFLGKKMETVYKLIYIYDQRLNISTFIRIHLIIQSVKLSYSVLKNRNFFFVTLFCKIVFDLSFGIQQWGLNMALLS